MAPQPQRRENRKTHLDASVAPVERALLARAEATEADARLAVELATADPQLHGTADVVPVLHRVASEFRALAEELHWW